MEGQSLFISPETISPHEFDHVIVFFSAGKDSQACFLHLLDLGVPKEKIELWHHKVDGNSDDHFMDWPVTDDYIRAFAKAFDVPLYFSWKEGGFEREMCRENALTAPTTFETPDGLITVGGERGKLSTRRKFPQLSADLGTRWCSSYLKIGIGAAAISNQRRFDGKRVMVVSGERAEESPARAKYKIAEPHRTNTQKREVWQWRPVHAWTEQQVWDIIARYRVNPHPAYRLGWSRLSCMTCIFGSPNQWASIQAIAPQRVIKIAKYEDDFGVNLRRDGPIGKAVARGKPYDMDPAIVVSALGKMFEEPVFVDNWLMPQGAFGECAGPV